MRVGILVLLLTACSDAPRATRTSTPSAPVAAPAPASADPAPTDPAPADPAPTPGTGLNEPDPNAPELACTATSDCVLVSQGCGNVTAVHRDYAVEAQRRFDAILAIGECGHPNPPDAAFPVCERRRCRAHPRPHPEVRRCRTNRDCTAIDWGCQWAAVSRHDEEAARRLMPIGPTCPGIMPQPPETQCLFRFCAFTDPAYGQ
jgi:hypothetical protein